MKTKKGAKGEDYNYLSNIPIRNSTNSRNNSRSKKK